MRHAIGTVGDRTTVSYQWRRGGTWEGMSATVSGRPALLRDDTEETFIAEHYWGYTRRRDRMTVEYRVEHPRWRVWRADFSVLECDVAGLYGPEFVDALSGAPSSAFVAEGSPVQVRRGSRLRPPTVR